MSSRLFLPTFALCAQIGWTQDKLYPTEFPLTDVRLTGGMFKSLQDLNGKTLLAYNVDRIMAAYYKEAGLTPKGSTFPNWSGLDGHFGGHYLSALAIHYAATGDALIKTRMDYVISEMQICQTANGKDPNFVGYLSGIPNGKAMFLKIKAGNPTVVAGYWAPWYNIHKAYAGLRDAWLYCGNETAKTMFLKLCDWGIANTGGLTDAQMEQMLETEHGGMDEVYADAYEMTRDVKYLNAAKRWAHKWLLNPMAAKQDNLDNAHANTQIPKVVGFARIGELGGGQNYTDAAKFFWSNVTEKRSIAIGGNSVKEYFPTAAKSKDFIDIPQGPETCNSYNMLKLTENLYRTTLHASYVDYYERTLYNHIASSIHPTHGGYVYFTPARPRHYRTYSKVNAAMWCCAGTGMENPGKYAQFAYHHKNDSLMVNLFLPSQLDWKEKGVKITQTTNFPEQEKSTLIIATETPTRFRLLVRHPSWVRADEFKVLVGTDTVSSSSPPSTYVVLDRLWNNGDSVTVLLPMHIAVEPLVNVPDYVSIVYGPMVLGARTGTESLTGLVADEGSSGQHPNGPLLDLTQAPIIAVRADTIAKRLVPVPGKPLTFKAPLLFYAKKDTSLVLEPFYKIHDARYMMYWMLLTNQKTLDSLAAIQQAQMLLSGRTVDKVEPGQQQPEVDHKMVQTGTTSGTSQGESYRDGGSCTGGSGASLGYEMSTGGESDLSLMVRYWGNETSCTRTFDIIIGGQKLATENIVGKWNKNAFVDVEYPIPNTLVASGPTATVKFQTSTGMIGGIFGVWILRKTPISTVRDKTRGGNSPLVRARRSGLEVELPQAFDQRIDLMVYDPTGVLVRRDFIPSGSLRRSISLEGRTGVHLVRILRNWEPIYAAPIFVTQ